MAAIAYDTKRYPSALKNEDREMASLTPSPGHTGRLKKWISAGPSTQYTIWRSSCGQEVLSTREEYGLVKLPQRILSQTISNLEMMRDRELIQCGAGPAPSGSDSSSPWASPVRRKASVG